MDTAIDTSLLILRLVLGALFIGHGGQKLFAWFGGSGLTGTTRSMAGLGLQPARGWAMLAGLTELDGGLLTLLGLLNPFGPVAVIASMAMAIVTVHWGKPIWASAGGAELPITNIAIALAVILAGPGRYSLDAALGIALPTWIAFPALAVVIAVIALALASRTAAPASAPGAAR
jgi:putative oxidoreductase